MLGSCPSRPVGRHNHRGVHDRESEGLIVAWKRGNARGAKGPCRYRAEARRGETRLQGRPDTTGEPVDDLPEAFRHNDGAPGVDGVSIRQVCDSAQESGRREVYDADLQSYFDTIPHEKLLACVRMREIRTSGSTRGA